MSSMSTLKKKVSTIFKPKRESQEDDFQIGGPRDFQATVHVKKSESGALEGLPQELENRLRNILSKEDIKDQECVDKATNAISWLNHYMQDDGKDKFMEPEQYEPEESEDPSNQAAQAPLRRQKTTKRGPRLSRTMKNEEVMEELKAICHSGSPNDVYQTDEELGAGASGRVYRARHRKTGQQVAIKNIDLSRQPKIQMILMEIKVMKEINHPNLVNFIEAFLLGKNLSLVMEYLAGGQLTDVVGK